MRDPYGVPKVEAENLEDTFRLFGFAVAEDRLWQMEMSRRAARGRLAEVMGPESAAADRQLLQRAYTREELTQQLAALPDGLQEAFEAYAEGVNMNIEFRRRLNALPEGYEELGFEPEPWTPTDSAAIAVSLSRRFGAGGAGELRNFALLEYLKTRPSLADKRLDVLDDFVWLQDPRATTTIPTEDAPAAPDFFYPSRQETEAHLEQLPPVGLFELVPAIQLFEQTEWVAKAQELAVPYKAGSYAIAVNAERSATGNALLLGAPQMGHTTPAVVHEIAIGTPGYRVAGINVPGIPVVVIGHTPNFAWTLTSAVIDLEDVVFSPLADTEIEEIEFELPVAGEEPETVVQQRTADGPVVLTSPSSGSVFSRRSAFWGRELASLEGIWRAPAAATVNEALGEIEQYASVGFNLFWADTQGNVGYRLLGRYPLRPAGYDPRLPLPAEVEWDNFLTPDQMPSVVNPAEGLLVNWNNKPVEWWPNGDTPVWGRIFRDFSLREELTAEKLGLRHLEEAARDIALKDSEFSRLFKPWVLESAEGAALTSSERDALAQLAAFDGWAMVGQAPYEVYRNTINEARRQVFEAQTGNFLNESFFRQAVQVSLIADALEGNTKVDWLGDRSRDEVLLTSFLESSAALMQDQGPHPARWSYAVPAFNVPEGPPVAYSARGTYIQITELSPQVYARNVVKPGVAEVGPHAADQVHLAREWRYKEMWTLDEE
jgi:penicillin amidase